jgi:hypothetical protein
MDCEIDTSHQARGYIYLAEADSLTCCGHVSYYSPRPFDRLPNQWLHVLVGIIRSGFTEKVDLVIYRHGKLVAIFVSRNSSEIDLNEEWPLDLNKFAGMCSESSLLKWLAQPKVNYIVTVSSLFMTGCSFRRGWIKMEFGDKTEILNTPEWSVLFWLVWGATARQLILLYERDVCKRKSSFCSGNHRYSQGLVWDGPEILKKNKKSKNSPIAAREYSHRSMNRCYCSWKSAKGEIL